MQERLQRMLDENVSHSANNAELYTLRIEHVELQRTSDNLRGEVCLCRPNLPPVTVYSGL